MIDWITRGDQYPYDAPDAWWQTNDPPPPPADWAHRAARSCIANLNSRHTIKHAFGGVDEETRTEIVRTLAEIIRKACVSQ